MSMVKKQNQKQRSFLTYSFSDMSAPRLWKCAGVLAGMFSAIAESFSYLDSHCLRKQEVQRSGRLGLTMPLEAPELVSAWLYRPGESFVLSQVPHVVFSMIRRLPRATGALSFLVQFLKRTSFFFLAAQARFRAAHL